MKIMNEKNTAETHPSTIKSKNQKINPDNQQSSSFLKTISNSLFHILLLVSMGFIIGLSLIIMLTYFPLPLERIYLVLILGVANMLFVFALIRIIKPSRAKNKERTPEKITKHPSKLIPNIEDLPGKDWKIIEEEDIPPEIVAWNKKIKEQPSKGGFGEAFDRIFEKGDKKIVFLALRFSSVGKAIDAFTGIYNDWENLSTYPISAGEEAVGVFNKSYNFDGALIRVANVHIFILVYRETGIKPKESTRYIKFVNEI